MTTQAVEFFRSHPRYLAARAVGGRLPGLITGPLATLRLVNAKDPEPLGPGWGRVRPLLAGICGSDLTTVSGRSSFYFSPLVSMPFVPGHEVVGELIDEIEDLPVGARVALRPVLGCRARGLEPCPSCEAGVTGRCDRITSGHIAAGLQTGYCKDTGGGWSRMFVAHRSQLHPVPDALDHRRAVLIEPLSVAVRAALRAHVRPNDEVLLIGAGTIGILTLLALKELTPVGRVIVAAKYPRQRAWAETFGATEVVAPRDVTNAVRRSTRATKLRPEFGEPFLLGGVDVTIDSAGSKGSLDLALRSTKAGGRIVLSGLPDAAPDLAPLWFRELELVGTYTGGMETLEGGDRRDAFELATTLAVENPIDRFVGATYPLSRWREAIDHALSAGKLGTLKVAFDPRAESI